MTRKASADPVEIRKQTREWLSAHTIRDARGVARDLENAGEDVSELLEAIDELESLISPGRLRDSRVPATAES